MLPLGNGEVVARLRATYTADRYNPNAVRPDWTNPTRVEIPGCVVYQGTVSEILEVGRTPADYDWTVILPNGYEIKADDRLEVRNMTFDVVGAPFEWRNPFTGWAPGQVVQCRLREG